MKLLASLIVKIAVAIIDKWWERRRLKALKKLDKAHEILKKCANRGDNKSMY